MAGGTKAKCVWACETYVTFIGWKQPIKASDPVKPACAPRCGFGLDRAIRLDERQTSQSKDRRPAGVSAPPTKGDTARWRVRRKGGDFMAVQDVPVWEKYTLTIEEAARYFRVGEGKLRRLAEQVPTPEWVIVNGNRVQIKRKKFEQFIDAIDVI